MKQIEKNMGVSGFGLVMEIQGNLYRDGMDPAAEPVFFAATERVKRKRYHSPEKCVCVFQEFRAGLAGEAQYVRMKYAGMRDAKITGLTGPGNLRDANPASDPDQKL